MSDFILSNNKIGRRNINDKINYIFDDISSNWIYYHGEWGIFYLTETPYYGFSPIENDYYIIGVIGGPVLKFTNNNEPNDDNHFTKLIFDYWYEGNMEWDQDLSGPFVVIIIDKHSQEFLIFTDLMSFIPVYQFASKTEKTYSSHVDLLGLLTKQEKDLDQVSIADFILHGIVTYPYTIYKKIKQVQPATQLKVKDNSEFISHYWEPYEDIKYNKKEAAQHINYALNDYISKVLARGYNTAQFISGGEDSRLLSSLLRSHQRDSFIFLDQMNREGKMAEKAAKQNNANFYYGLRSFHHYLEILPQSSRLVGSGNQYIHAHTYGFHNQFSLNQYDSVFGGLFADALLKGSRIGKARGTGRPYIPEIKQEKSINQIDSDLFDYGVISELTERRKAHLALIKSYRNESANEWFFLWPTSMNVSFANMHVNRRLFASYEPFLDNNVVKTSAQVPQKLKLNRRLFHKLSKPYLKNTKFLFHSDRRLPYFSWYINIPISLVVTAKNFVFKKLGLTKGVQGPWNDKNALIESHEFKESLYNLQEQFPQLQMTNSIEGMIHQKMLTASSSFNLLQTLYLLEFLKNGDE